MKNIVIFILGFMFAIAFTFIVFYANRNLISVVFPPDKPAIPIDSPAAVSSSTAQERAKLVQNLDFSNTQDFEFASRGFIATRKDPLIKKADGTVIYDLSSYAFLKGEAPDTANPSLWRQAQLLTKHGLYKVAEHIYQVRGFDISTTTFIESKTGWIVVDTLTTMEVARAAYELVSEHLGQRPIVAIIYSHSHADHFGGSAGLVDVKDVTAGKVQVIAPEGFLERAVSENIIAGNAMTRRARYQFGLTLPSAADGEITSGLGPSVSKGEVSLIAPTVTINKTGQEMTVDGVRLVFQMTPGTEAPSEMNFYLPDMRAVFMAENANATMHNLLPARGALVRDAKAWADYLTQAIRLFGDKSDVMFAAHGIPRFGQAEINDFLKKHRDAYKFLHDQGVRLMNAGLTGSDIAEVLQLPEILSRQWYNRGYYGTMNSNAKAVYQMYMGWYDGNPAHLNELPPAKAAVQYVEAMGGAQAVLEKAEVAVHKGDYRWAAMMLNHLVFADASNQKARNLLADVYTQMGYGSESGIWRNIYLTGAQELRHGVLNMAQLAPGPHLSTNISTSMMLDLAAVRFNSDKAKGEVLKIQLNITDRKEKHLVTVENGVMIHELDVTDPTSQVTLSMHYDDLLQTLLAGVPLSLKTATGAVKIDGDRAVYEKLMSYMEPADSNFNIVEPLQRK